MNTLVDQQVSRNDGAEPFSTGLGTDPAIARAEVVPVMERPTVIRGIVCLHAVVLFVLPKNTGGFLPLRPEDLTSVLVLAVCGILLLSSPVIAPNRVAVPVVGLYFLTTLSAMIAHDGVGGHLEASIFWFKEVSYVAFAYLIWRAYRTSPGSFVSLLALVSLPNIIWGIWQVLTGVRGIYGASPLGHEASPASSGMLYFAYSLVMYQKYLVARHPGRFLALLSVSLLLVVYSGSKLAVLGAFVYFGWLLAQYALKRTSIATIGRLGTFVLFAVLVVASAEPLVRLGFLPGALSRYSGFFSPIEVLSSRGIWGKLRWIDDPISVMTGAGYSPGHINPDGSYSYGMSMDNQVLFYLVVGGAVSLLLYGILMFVLYLGCDPSAALGRALRALVVSYCFMGLGAEVLQLSVYGNVFWMMVALCWIGLTDPRSTSGTAHTAS